MTTRRKLAKEEQRIIARRLVRLDAAIADTYKFPVEDLVYHLRKRRKNVESEVEEENGVAIKYYLDFSSPQDTWGELCGRAGIYTVDAESLRAIGFHTTSLS